MHFLETTGIRIVERGSGRAVAVLEVQPWHLNPSGAVHGGLLCTLADGALAHAAWSTNLEAATVVTAELKVNFLQEVRSTTITARSQVLYRGTTSVMGDVGIEDLDGNLVAFATGTMVLKFQTGSPEA